MNPAELFKKSHTESTVEKQPFIKAYREMIAEGISRNLRKEREKYEAEIAKNIAEEESVIYKIRRAITNVFSDKEK
jgi:hypothetical protein